CDDNFGRRFRCWSMSRHGNRTVDFLLSVRVTDTEKDRYRRRDHSGWPVHRLLGGLRPSAQNFRDAPCLRDAAAGHVRLPRVKNFADRHDAVVAQVHGKGFKKFSRGGSIVRMNFQPRIDERPDQPGPNRALVIRTLSGTKVTAINRFVIWIVWRKRAQTDRREQFFLRNFENRFPMFCVENRMIEREGDQLIWPAGRIVCTAAINIDNIVKVTALRE